MSRTAEIKEILVRVEAWPVEECVTLAYQILRDMRVKVLDDAPRQTLDSVAGLLHGPGSP